MTSRTGGENWRRTSSDASEPRALEPTAHDVEESMSAPRLSAYVRHPVGLKCSQVGCQQEWIARKVITITCESVRVLREQVQSTWE